MLRVTNDIPRPEILSPVGDWEMCRAAVENGADAIYVGVPEFNARGRTADFSLKELDRLLRYCRLHGVRTHLAMNVLVFESELAILPEFLSDLLQLAPDVFIVQDLGLARLIRKMAPQQELHASTQMTITCAEAIALTEDLDLARYVLARELSLGEIERIRKDSPAQLEVFVHGALCVAYSGQCLTSESFGGRSANRGQCAQSCRLPYSLIVDGETKELGDRRYLVSPQDLQGLEQVPRLRQMGIESLKIEGRLKTPAYVAATTRAYSRAARGLEPESRDQEALALTFSRGFFSGWLEGVNHQKLVSGEYSDHRGLPLGTVIQAGRREVVLATTRLPAPGEGVFFADDSRQVHLGSRVYASRLLTETTCSLRLASDFPYSRLSVGMKAFLNDSPHIEKELASVRSASPGIALEVKVVGRAGAPLRLEVCDLQGNTASSVSDAPMEIAAQHPLREEEIRKALSPTSKTPFFISSWELDLEPGLYLNHKTLRKLRQAYEKQLIQLRESPRPGPLTDPESIHIWREASRSRASGESPSPTRSLTVLVRSAAQVADLLDLPVAGICLDFEYGRDYRQVMQSIRQAGLPVSIATTRILKPGEHGHLRKILSLQPDRILVRNLGALQVLRDSGIPLTGDFSLNATNSLSTEYLLQKGLERLCPSYDLNQWQLLDLADSVDASRLEVTLHQYIPAFHMEHCVFAAFLSKGSSWRDCGKPCERHRVELKDHTNAIHPLLSDQECRNTMFNGQAQTAARLIPELCRRGIGHFRFEALTEDAATLRKKVQAYLSLLQGALEVEEALRNLAAVEGYGIGEGQLKSRKVHRSRKKTLTTPPL